MERDNRQDYIEITKTQLPKTVGASIKTSWLSDPWHILMIVLGLVVSTAFGILIISQVVSKERNSYKFDFWNDDKKISSSEKDNMKTYQNVDMRIGLKYSEDISIKNPLPNELIFSLPEQENQEKISVFIVGLNKVDENGELLFYCTNYLPGCTKKTELSSDYVNSNKMSAKIIDVSLGRKSLGVIKMFIFRTEGLPYLGLAILPTSEAANEFAEKLAEELFLMK